jgi:hypothetical protein
MTVVYMKDSVKLLKQNIKNVKIIGNERNAAFSSTGSPFGYREKMLPIREMCFKYAYAKKLCTTPKRNKITNIVKHINSPLGYENTQALTIFEHSTPNNTLPIIWSSRSKWWPLFPRIANDRINIFKAEKEQAYFWIRLFEKLNLKGILPDKNNFYSQKNLKLIILTRLLKRNLSLVTISNIMNTSMNELDSIIQGGIQSGILTKDGNISQLGNSLYEKISKQSRRNLYNQPTPNESLVYIPSKFRGKT